MRKGFAALTLMLATTAVAAQPAQYVTDRLEITLRSGQTNQHRIVKMLTSGTEVRVLEKDDEAGYTRVRIPDGTEGWVLTRYLVPQPVARDQLAAADAAVAKLTAELEQARGQLSTVSTSQKSLEQNHQSLESQNRKLQQELNQIRQTAANALNLDSENQEIKKQLVTLEREYQVLQQQTESLKDRSRRDWFMAGAGVVILGMILGLLIPKIRWKRRSSWDSL
jgi:SH3 domain protein